MNARFAGGLLALLGVHCGAAAQDAASFRALPAAAPTVEEVGDVDSFKCGLRWLGVEQMNVDLLETCPPGPIEDYACQELAPSGTTLVAFEDVARIELPSKASNSILCHWFSPFLNLAWNNTTATSQLGTLTYTPTLTIENPVLGDPALINPQTGLPFGGSLLSGMTVR